jgi:hypothetical protein
MIQIHADTRLRDFAEKGSTNWNTMAGPEAICLPIPGLLRRHIIKPRKRAKRGGMTYV